MVTVRPKKEVLRVILLGNSQSGKTSLITRYIYARFTRMYRHTIAADFFTMEIELDKGVVSLQIWDTAGGEGCSSLGAAFYRGADVCVLVYDCREREGLSGLEDVKSEFLTAASPSCPALFPMVLVGCKADSELQVTMGAAQTWARNQGDLPVFLTSARDDLHRTDFR